MLVLIEPEQEAKPEVPNKLLLSQYCWTLTLYQALLKYIYMCY